MPRSSSMDTGRVFHSCEPRKAMARSRPSSRVRTRRLSDELKPRALMLKSLTPLCTRSTPGACASASGAWPVGAVDCSTRGSMAVTAAGASTIRSGSRDAAETVTSASDTGTASSDTSRVTSPLALISRVTIAYPGQRKTMVWAPAGTRWRT